MQRTLVAFDTDRIKKYVFGTDKLKEIRGASAILDRLNRVEMEKMARELQMQVTTIYTNGGSGLFLVDGDREQAEKFVRRVRREYIEQTGRESSISYVVQDLPEGVPQDIEELLNHPLGETFELLRFCMTQKKDTPVDHIAFPSHPFMRQCESCGRNYADGSPVQEPGRGILYCCTSCNKKRTEDDGKNVVLYRALRRTRAGQKTTFRQLAAKELWDRMIEQLRADDYDMPDDVERPQDFNVFRDFGKSKEYIGLIYADGNNMGAQIENLNTLNEIRGFALDVDGAIHQAMSAAIITHLPVTKDHLFPFDILLLGGDDIVLAVSATKAMDVALTLGMKFREFTQNKYSLSIGVVLAPVKYPFGLLQDLAEEALKDAKKASARARKAGEQDDTRLSFLVIAGGSVHSYGKAVKALTYEKKEKVRGEEKKQKPGPEFHATLRPYAPATLKKLLDAIEQANKFGMNRTKLHQLREVVLKMNMTTSVGDSLAALRNWRPDQRLFAIKLHYQLALKQDNVSQNEQNLLDHFPRFAFPWYLDGKNQDNQDIYRTSLLDFIELYDFVQRGAGNDALHD